MCGVYSPLVDGAKYERELMDILQALGNFVVRSAGSHNTDLIVISLRTGAVMIVEVKSFTGNVYSVRRKKKEYEQWQAIMCLIKELPSFVTVRYALRQKGGKGDRWRLISPSMLEKPYHWDAPISFDIHAPSIQSSVVSASAPA